MTGPWTAAVLNDASIGVGRSVEGPIASVSLRFMEVGGTVIGDGAADRVDVVAAGAST